MILVFKTDIKDNQSVEQVGQLLDGHSDIYKWNIDRWDIDNVLRIESQIDCTEHVIKSLSEAGFYCATLED